MILRPKTLEELSSQIKQLPEEKRRVIITVGRHPNEGTIRIAQRHHQEWEKHGAVVIQLPKEWTPHYFWRQIDKTARQQVFSIRPTILGKIANIFTRPSKKRKQSEEILALAKKQADQIPSDSTIAEHILKLGIISPVLSFHAGGKILNPQRASKYVTLTPGAKIQLLNTPTFTVNQDFEPAANELIIEYGTHATHPVLKKAREISKRIDDLNLRRGLLVPQYEFGQLDKDYLQYGSMSRQGLNEFATHHSQSFNSLLAHLAKNGLKK